MPLKTHAADKPPVLSDVLLVEINPQWSRETITLAPLTAALPVGAVLARMDDGNYVPFLKAAGDDQVAAVLIKDAPKNNAAQKSVAVVRGAVIAASNLTFLSSVNAENKAKALGQMKALGIVPQE